MEKKKKKLVFGFVLTGAKIGILRIKKKTKHSRMQKIEHPWFKLCFVDCLSETHFYNLRIAPLVCIEVPVVTE